MSSVIRGEDDFDSGYMLGVNQTWQDVTLSRDRGVVYTNDTGKPIMVNITISTFTSDKGLDVDGVRVSTLYESTTFDGIIRGTLSAIVPNGSTYEFVSTAAHNSWVELRGV